MKRIQESHERKSSYQKLEAEADGHEKNLKIWDCGSPLYDSYELVSVSHMVERHFMIFPNAGYSKMMANDHHRVRRTSEFAISASEKPARDDTNVIEKSSVFSFLSWKRKKMDGERKAQNAKKLKIHHGISRVFSWNK